jgi:trigger factor
MQVSIESTGPLEREMTVRIPAARINTEVNNRLASLSRTAKIDGFRKGKVPYKLVERRYGQQIREEVLGDAVRKTFYEAVSAEKLRPAGNPSIEALQEVDQTDNPAYEYKAKFEVYPEIALASVEQLKIALPVCTVIDADVRKQGCHWHGSDQPAALGDRVTMDFFGTVEGHTFEGGEANGFQVELGSGTLIKGFEESLVGAVPGKTVELDLQFPDSYRDAKLAGKPVHFRVLVTSVEYAHLPELDGQFFAGFGVDEGGLDVFRGAVRMNMERECNQKIQAQLKANVVSALLDANQITRPKVLIDGEIQRLRQDMVQRLTAQGMPNMPVESLSPTLFEAEAQRRVGAGLIMSEIVRSANLTADPAKVRLVIEGLASSYEDSSRVIRWYYEDRTRLAEAESLVLENETVDWLLARASVEERSTSFDALMNPVQTGNAT